MRAQLIFMILLTALVQAELPQHRIGFITPLSGPRASIGEDARRGVLLALEVLRQQGQPVPDVMFEDSQGTPQAGVTAFKKLQNLGVRFIITQNSNVSVPISPLANRGGILQLAVTTTSDSYSSPSDLSFRVNGSTKEEAEKMRTFLHQSRAIALFTMQDEYPETLHRHLIEGQPPGTRIVLDQEFLPHETDFRALVSKAKSKGADDVVCLGYQLQCGMLVKQLREAGSQARVLVNTPVNNREFFEAAGKVAEGTYGVYPAVDLSHPAARRYSTRFGMAPSFFASNAYDAVILLTIAFERCGSALTPACAATELTGIKHYSGLSGQKGFDDVYGDMQDTYEILMARSGRFVRAAAR